jgi:hypothetical protein
MNSIGSKTKILSVDDLLVYINEKWNEGLCECCGKSSWIFGGNHSEQTGALIRPSEDGNYSVPGSHLAEVYVMVCNNCGNVRLLSRYIVDKWFAERAAS